MINTRIRKPNRNIGDKIAFQNGSVISIPSQNFGIEPIDEIIILKYYNIKAFKQFEQIFLKKFPNNGYTVFENKIFLTKNQWNSIRPIKGITIMRL